MPVSGGFIMVLPLKITSGSGAPARVVGFIPKKKTTLV